jgi:hypothetical protein
VGENPSASAKAVTPPTNYPTIGTRLLARLRGSRFDAVLVLVRDLLARPSLSSGGWLPTSQAISICVERLVSAVVADRFPGSLKELAREFGERRVAMAARQAVGT